MLIDWFTVGAQAVNFLVLLWLMKRYLYKPILNAIEARETRIADELAAAADQVADAERTRQELVRQTGAFEASKAALMAEAVNAASAELDRLLKEARTEGDALRQKQQTLLQEEKSADAEKMRQLVIGEVFAIARRALGDLANAELEDCLVASFVSRLRELVPAEKELWEATAAAPNVQGTVRSRFELRPALRELIRTAVEEVCTVPMPLNFATMTDLLGGIDLTANGRRLSWDFDGYLRSLEQHLAIP